MTEFDVLGVPKLANSSSLKISANGAFLKGEHEERVVSLQLLGESSQSTDSPKPRCLRTSSRANVLGSG